MVRWVVLGALIIVLTAVCTVAVQLMPASSSDRPAFPTLSGSEKTGPLPKAVVDGVTKFEFGTKAQKTVGEKSWIVRNEGEGDLELRKGPPACSCTVARLGPDDIAGDKDFAKILKPGEELEVMFRFETRDNNGKYHKEIKIITNDPTKPEILFEFEGIVQPPFLTYPPGGSISFLNVSNEVEQTTKLALYSTSKPDFKIEQLSSSRPDDMKVDVTPLSDEEQKSLGQDGPGGYMLTVKLREGMGIGVFREELLVKTDNPMKPEFTISVTGQMAGPISTIPPAIEMTAVNGAVGGSKDLSLIVRGQKVTNFTVASKPEKLNITIDPADQVGEGATKYRLGVTIPPGTPGGAIKGDVILKTDHPLASEMKIPVSIYVRNAN